MINKLNPVKILYLKSPEGGSNSTDKAKAPSNEIVQIQEKFARGGKLTVKEFEKLSDYLAEQRVKANKAKESKGFWFGFNKGAEKRIGDDDSYLKLLSDALDPDTRARNAQSIGTWCGKRAVDIASLGTIPLFEYGVAKPIKAWDKQVIDPICSWLDGK